MNSHSCFRINYCFFTVKVLCEVKYAYKAQNGDELSLKEGDIVTVISQDGQDPGWWLGELNGQTGVFPDNFVSIINENKHKPDRRSKTQDSAPIKPSSVASQRKSVESKTDKSEPDNANKVTPPLPSKKPLLPIKKSPSGGISGGGLFSGIKKKIADAVDGSTGSKSATVSKISDSKPEVNNEQESENAFDQVGRRPLLSDVRATRAKAPGE